MPYHARVLKVMIASPGDVPTERQQIRDVLHEWNAVHSEDKGIVLIPVSWETHAQPTMGDRPQVIINKQILDACDLLVAVFWTRIGSPTGASPSGTVEEIEEHLRAGKSAMIYFSRAPVRRDSVDDSQYKALLEFRRQCERRGLVESYDSITEFREKFARQLAQLIIREYAAGTVADSPSLGAAQLQRGIVPLLQSFSSPTRELLLEASQDKHGVIIRVRTMKGLGIQTNGRQFVDRGDPRSEARWDAALQQLREHALLQDMGSKGEVYNLTDKGYEVADRLRGGAAPA